MYYSAPGDSELAHGGHPMPTDDRIMSILTSRERADKDAAALVLNDDGLLWFVPY